MFPKADNNDKVFIQMKHSVLERLQRVCVMAVDS